jgi:hypothetical protein
MLVETRHGKAGSQLSHNSIRQAREEKTEQCLTYELDGGSILDCRSGIGRGDGSFILTINSKPNPNSCSFFVLRSTEWQWTVSLWLQTSFVIWRQMWGETSGRWEGSPVGKKFGTGFKILIFCGFPATYRFQNFGLFRGFPRFLGDPKKSQNADFSTVSRDFEGQARSKILCGFPTMNRAQNLDFPTVSHDF